MYKDIIVYVQGIKCRANRINVTCYESYNLDNDSIEKFVYLVRSELSSVYNINYERSVSSWVKEIYTHNVLYRRNIWIQSTKDTDLTDGEEWYRLFFYNIIWYLGKFKRYINNILKK